MAGKTYGGTYSSGVTLTNPAYNPATIPLGATITNAGGAGVTGSAAYDWTIDNSGIVAATGSVAGSYGILLGGTGSITNDGAISGYQTGVSVAGAGSVVNAGTISASQASGKGYYYNTLTSTFTPFDAGIVMAGGSVSNLSSGVISDYFMGVALTAGGTLTNQGSITAASIPAGITRISFGVILLGGGAVTNDAGGVVTGGLDGVIGAPGGPTSVTNQGSIGGSKAGIYLHAAGTVSNTGSGVISGTLTGAWLKGGGSLYNSGDIVGNYAVALTAGGTVANTGGGTIAGANYGVLIASGAGSVTNDGRISATNVTNGSTAFNSAGVDVFSGGSVYNDISGTITAKWIGVQIGNHTALVGGTLINQGDIFASDGTNGAAVWMHGPGLISNAATGTISGGPFGVVTYYQATQVTNLGSIFGSEDGILATGGGTLLNQGGITTTVAGYGGGIVLDGGAMVTNTASGSINSANDGVAFKAGSSSTLINSGTISGGSAAVYSAGTSAGVSVINAGSLINSGTNPAVGLHDGGYVSNAAITGTITGAGGVGVYITGAAGTVVNAGMTDQVYLRAGGGVTNQANGTIAGGVKFATVAASLTNAGMIQSDGTHVGVFLNAGGVVTNLDTASITSVLDGVYATGAAVSVVNDGSIAGTTQFGVLLQAGGSVTNAAFASITGSFAVDLSGGGTLTNAGTINGTGGTAVYLGGTGSNLLVLESGFGFSGAVAGGASASNTLELASAASAGTLAGLGTQFTNFGAITFDAGARWSIAGGTASLAGGEVISGFAAGDTIDLVGVTETIGSFASGTLSLGGSAALDLQLPGSFTTAQFSATPSGDGTDITVACFAAATRILTASGEVPVEALREGDLVPALAGGLLRRVVWIGQTGIDLDRHPRPDKAAPIRVRAHAFAPGMPHRDLVLSPDHALAVEGVLIPVHLLVNGASIVRLPARGTVRYFHVELDAHDVLLAEGLAAESYLDTGNRGVFAGSDEARPLHPDLCAALSARAWDERSCAPLLLGGSLVQQTHHRLLRRAEELGHVMTGDAALRIIADGVALASEASEAGMLRVVLPEGTSLIRLVSRRAIPAHTRPDSDDRRCLGVAVGGIRLDGRQVPLTDPRLGCGWHAAEQELRWTDGDAALAPAGARVIDIAIAMTERYWLEAEEPPQRAATLI
jgi:collagen type I/II/III/V/XI/XXIV/XXVII alpha